MNFIKKYYPMIISLALVLIYSLIIGAILIYNFDESNYILLVPAVFLTIGLIVETIVFIIHVIKNKELKNKFLWVFLIYTFNIVTIPYYNLKYVVKEEKITSKMVKFIILLFLFWRIFTYCSNFL